VKVRFDAKKILTAVSQGVTGESAGGRSAVVGPTLTAWYGKLHEFGLGHFPARPFMRPALNLALREIPTLFRNLIKGKGIPALKAAGMIVEAFAKASMKAGGGEKGEPSTPPDPPNVQTGNLRNSIQWALTQRGG
jgi:hypothetical protein